MPVILGLLFIIALAVLPSLWVHAVIARHGVDRPDLPGTGGELARHLLDGMGLPQRQGRGDRAGRPLRSGIEGRPPDARAFPWPLAERRRHRRA